MMVRLISSSILVLVWGWLEFAYNTATPLIVGDAAGSQFDSSDKSYFAFNMINRAVTEAGGFLGAGLMVLLLLIWVPYIIHLLKTQLTEE